MSDSGNRRRNEGLKKIGLAVLAIVLAIVGKGKGKGDA